jgi:hypothetical protein
MIFDCELAVGAEPPRDSQALQKRPPKLFRKPAHPERATAPCMSDDPGALQFAEISD